MHRWPVRIGREAPDARDRAPLGRQPRPAIADDAAGDRPGARATRTAAIVERDGPQVADVAVRPHGAARHHRDPPIASEVVLLDHDLATDVFGNERSAVGHPRQGSGLATFRDGRVAGRITARDRRTLGLRRC